MTRKTRRIKVTHVEFPSGAVLQRIDADGLTMTSYDGPLKPHELETALKIINQPKEQS